MKDYGLFYEKITAPLRQRPGALRALKAANRVLTFADYAIYPAILLGALISGFRAGGASQALRDFLPYLLVPGIGFVLVSLVRGSMNAPRPYETWPIEPLIYKNTKGHSMPSRHVFSSSVIAMCALRVHWIFGVVMLLLSLFLAFVRVLGGVHYPKDVAAGYAIGVLTGLILFLF